MKTLHFAIITGCVIGIFVTLGMFLLFDQWQQESHIVEIQNIQVEPATIKVGDSFTVSAELVNNSQNPIRVADNHCGGTFVIFDSHVTVDSHGTRGTGTYTCADYLEIKIVNPGKKIIIVYPISTTFIATEAGITNATATFDYFENEVGTKNFPNIKKTISKSFLFTISN